MKMTMTGKNAEAVVKTRDSGENALKSLMKAANRWYLKNKAEEDKRMKENSEEENVKENI